MARPTAFERPWGTNWVTGRSLLPLLEEWGGEIRGTVVDVGCGQSPFRHLFPRAKSFVRLDRFPADSEVIAADACSLPLADASADAVLYFQVLADVAEPRRALLEAFRVLRPGGQVFVFESMAYPEHDMPHDYYRIMPAGLAFLAEGAGFEVKAMERLGGLFTRWPILWNVVIVSRISRIPLLAPLAFAASVVSNVLCHGLDRLYRRPSLASDYLARLVKPAAGPSATRDGGAVCSLMSR